MTQGVDRLVRHVTASRFEDLPAPAVAAVKTFCLDTIGVSVAGTAARYAAETRAAVGEWGNGDEAAVLGSGSRLPAAAAAMVNALHAHNQEFDCVHEAAVVHPLTTVQSAALAVAERAGGVTGRELILALALGVDVATSIGMAAKTGLRFFRPATAGVFGATAAVGKLAGLDAVGLKHALGLAYAQNAGTMQSHVEGGPALALQMGFAAVAAIRAVDLARAGVPGPHDVLEGPFGYFRLYEGEWDLEPVWAELGTVWRITQVSHKPFPTGRAAHGGLDGILQLRSAHGLQADNVDRLTLAAPPLIHQLVGRPATPDMDVTYAHLCFQYVGALALLNGGVDVADFGPERLADPTLHNLARRIELVADGNADPNALAPQAVTARLKDGRALRVDVSHTLGSPERPLSRDRHLDKFRRCWSCGVHPLADEAGDRLIHLVDGLDQVDNSNEIVALTRPGAC
jgi:2-methylcitrate dehydratase PrpD